MKNRLFKFINVITLISTFSIMPLQSYNIINPIEVSAVYEEWQDQIMEHNSQKMDNIDNINSYSEEFVLDYITTSHDYYEVVDTLNQIQEISNSLCEGASNDYEKLQKIHDYVCENIAYDYIAKENFANLDTICLKSVLETNRTICAGYSNIFSALCDAQGLYCLNVRGSVITSEYPDLASEDVPTNHEWNAVWLESENRWVYIDCTWDSNYIYDENGFQYTNDNKKYVNTYFDMSAEKMAENHKIKIVNYWDFFTALDCFNTTETDSPESNTNNDTQTTIHTTIESIDTTIETNESLETTLKSETSNLEEVTKDTISSTIQQIETASDTSDTYKGTVLVLICAVVLLIGMTLLLL